MPKSILTTRSNNFKSHATYAAQPRQQTTNAAHFDFNSHAPYGAQRMLIYFYIIPDRISTHTPHAGRNLNYIRYWQANGEFQLTRPMRGATLSPTPLSSRANISTHTPHAGRNAQARGCSAPQSISTHTPHAGRNPIYCV